MRGSGQNTNYNTSQLESPISSVFGQQHKVENQEPILQQAEPTTVVPLFMPPLLQPAAKLMSYVEKYRLMIDKMQQFDRIIKSKKDYCFGEGAGRTLDMSSKRLRMGADGVISYGIREKGGSTSSGHP